MHRARRRTRDGRERGRQGQSVQILVPVPVDGWLKKYPGANTQYTRGGPQKLPNVEWNQDWIMFTRGETGTISFTIESRPNDVFRHLRGDVSSSEMDEHAIQSRRWAASHFCTMFAHSSVAFFFCLDSSIAMKASISTWISWCLTRPLMSSSSQA